MKISNNQKEKYLKKKKKLNKIKKETQFSDDGEKVNDLEPEPTVMEGVDKPKKKKHKMLNDDGSNTLDESKETSPKKKKKKLSMYPPLQLQSEGLNEAPETVPLKKKKKLCPPNEDYKPGMLSNMLQTKKHGQLILPWDPSFGLDTTYKLPEMTDETPKLKINPLFDLSKRQKATSKSAGKKETTIFVGNLPSNTTVSQLRSLFKCCGSVRQFKIKRNKQMFKKENSSQNGELPDSHNSKSAFAYLTLDSPEAVEAALELSGGLFRGQHIRVTLKEDDGQANKDTSIFVGNLDYTVQDDHLWQTFEKCGEIDSVRTIRDSRTGRGKGYGYINFKSADGVEAALKLNGSTLLDRALRVSRHDSKARSLSNSTKVSKHKLKNKKKKAQNVTKTKSAANFSDSGSAKTSARKEKTKQEEEDQGSANTKVKKRKKNHKVQEPE